MKISRISIRALAEPAGDRCLLRLDTDDGIRGSAVGSGFDPDMARALTADVLVGQDPRAAVSLWARLLERVGEDAWPPAALRAAAALDVAVWDLKARANGEPLWRTLGGARPRARALLRLPPLPAGCASMPEDWREAVSRQGFRAGILPVGFDEAAESAVAAELLEALAANGPNPELILDCGARWSASTALEIAGAWESHLDIARVQADYDAWTEADCRRVSEGLAAAASRADGASGPEQAFPPLRRFCFDVAVADPALRGVTGTLQLADAAYGYELPVVLAAAPGGAGAHLAGAMPYFMGLEVRIVDDGVPGAPDGGVRVEHGCAVVGDGPGLGWDAAACGPAGGAVA